MLDNNSEFKESEISPWKAEKGRDWIGIGLSVFSIIIAIYAVVSTVKIKGFEELLLRSNQVRIQDSVRSVTLSNQMDVLIESIDSLAGNNNKLNTSNLLLSSQYRRVVKNAKIETRKRSARFRYVYHDLRWEISKINRRWFFWTPNVGESLKSIKKIQKLLYELRDYEEIISDDLLFVQWETFAE